VTGASGEQHTPGTAKTFAYNLIYLIVSLYISWFILMMMIAFINSLGEIM